MRDRRGELRALGYSFHRDGDTYAFTKTINILENNVVPPPGASRSFGCNYVQALEGKKQAFIGDIGLLGARLVHEGDEVVIYRRSCPHEGAGLDHDDCKGGYVTCRWHGRKLKPIGHFAWGKDSAFAASEYAVTIKGNSLTILYSGNEIEGQKRVADPGN